MDEERTLSSVYNIRQKSRLSVLSMLTLMVYSLEGILVRKRTREFNKVLLFLWNQPVCVCDCLPARFFNSSDRYGTMILFLSSFKTSFKNRKNRFFKESMYFEVQMILIKATKATFVKQVVREVCILISVDEVVIESQVF